MSTSLRIKAEKSEERPEIDLKVRGEVEEVDQDSNVRRERRNSQLKPKNQQKQPQLDLFVYHIFYFQPSFGE